MDVAPIVKFFNKSENNHGTKDTYVDFQQRFSKQIIQPYILPVETKPQESSRNESINGVPRPVRTSQNASNDIVTVEYLPSQEIALQGTSITLKYSPARENSSNDSSHTVPDERSDIENVGDFGQRVRSASFKHRNENHGRARLRQPVDVAPTPDDYRKQHRKNSRPVVFKKLNFSESVGVSLDDRPLSSAADTQRTLKQKETKEDYRNNITTTKDSSPSTVAPVLMVSLGKFSGPIVVPDLPPFQKKYPYTVTTNYNDALKPTPTLDGPTTKTKGSEAGYPAASPVVLNHLQVGVALMNAGQDINSVSEPIGSTNDYLQDESQPAVIAVANESVVQNDATDSSNSDLRNDQLSQQEQISEVVASNTPTQSVEIQKSVEIFHTAPVQEIHYPVEFVPHVQQLPLKQRLQETDYRKPQKGQSKDRRPGQVNVYKSNEIADETVPVNGHEHARYEYNLNENDVAYSATNGQVDQALPVVRSADVKPVYVVREQVDNGQYDQSIVKYPRVHGSSDTANKEAQNDFDPTKSSSTVVAQPSRVIESLSGLVNLESSQGTQEVPQILLTKATSEPQTELRVLMTVPQPYPVEKIIEKTVHVPHSIDVVEKKVPYPVEKVIEKQIAIPHPFPVHIPIDRVVEKQIRIPYPVHVEKVVEKKVPIAIQRFIVPFPIHFRVPQPVAEKPLPVAVEKIHEKTVHLSRPYPLENAKLVKSVAIPAYNVHNDGNFQQVYRQQSFQTLPGPSYGPAVDEQSYFNSTQYYGLGYASLPRQPLVHALPKKFGSHGIQYPHSMATYSTSIGHNGNSVPYGRATVEKDKIIDEYVGPVPRKVPQSSLGIQSKTLQYSSPDIQATMRRTRQEGVTGNTNSFRQSKMEYGFKPPMVPSVQYDEQTATKVE
ncbi:uncharacterized protein LOC143153317 [Ptiloglossa arizonensis]|uniref:uncharacterized protein LOC143153317 n=1 Tax=Ptiloglossa arizonensis TaxID=3350558 RepID=UPI003F9F0BAC